MNAVKKGPKVLNLFFEINPIKPKKNCISIINIETIIKKLLLIKINVIIERTVAERLRERA